MNDAKLRDFTVLIIQEPLASKKDKNLITVPMGYYNWMKITMTI
jgi:hypothetical protein